MFIRKGKTGGKRATTWNRAHTSALELANLSRTHLGGLPFMRGLGKMGSV